MVDQELERLLLQTLEHMLYIYCYIGSLQLLSAPLTSPSLFLSSGASHSVSLPRVTSCPNDYSGRLFLSHRNVYGQLFCAGSLILMCFITTRFSHELYSIATARCYSPIPPLFISSKVKWKIHFKFVFWVFFLKIEGQKWAHKVIQSGLTSLYWLTCTTLHSVISWFVYLSSLSLSKLFSSSMIERHLNLL